MLRRKKSTNDERLFDLAYGGRRKVLRVVIQLQSLHAILHRDVLYLLDPLGKIDDFVLVKHLLCTGRHLRDRAFLREDQRGFQLLFFAEEFLFCKLVAAEILYRFEDGFLRFPDVGRVDPRVDIQDRTLRVRGDIRVNGIGKSHLFAHRLEQAGTHSPAENVVDKHGRVHQFVLSGKGRITEGNMHLLNILVLVKTAFRKGKFFLSLLKRSADQRGRKIFFHQRDRLFHADVPRERVEEAVKQFTGRIYQRPPRRSAVKRALRIRVIHRIELLDMQDRLVLIRVRCEAGTYIRSLCVHIGRILGCGSQMIELRRTRSGGFSVEDTHTLHEIRDAVERGDEDLIRSMLLPPEKAITDIPKIVVTPKAADAVAHGAVLAGVGVLQCDPFVQKQSVAIVTEEGKLIALAEAVRDSAKFVCGEPGFVARSTRVFVSPNDVNKKY